MDENTKKMIKERFEALPESIKEIILSSHYQDTLIELGKKYQLTVEQMGMMEQETTLVMMGLTPTKDFETELTRELKIDKTKGAQIVTDINEKVFLAIRDLLKLMYTPAGEEPSVDEEVENPLESQEEMLSQLEINDKELSAPIINVSKVPFDTKKEEERNSQMPSILAQKLGGSFQIPKVETDHSLSNVTGDSDVEKTKIPQADPYRMPID